MTEAMPFLQKYDITFLRPLPIGPGGFLCLQERIIAVQRPLLVQAVGRTVHPEPIFRNNHAPLIHSIQPQLIAGGKG